MNFLIAYIMLILSTILVGINITVAVCAFLSRDTLDKKFAMVMAGYSIANIPFIVFTVYHILGVMFA